MKVKDFFKTLKETWKNPKGKALIKLCLYFLFMFSVIIFVNISSLNKPRKIIHDEYKKNNNDNYEYLEIININNKNFNIEGIRYKNKENIKIIELNKEINIENNTILNESILENSLLNNLNFLNFQLDKIENILTQKQNSKSITYNDGSKKTEYLLNTSELNLFKDNITVDYKIVKYEKNNDIIKLEIDVTNLYKAINKNINTSLITIEYKNIGNISDFNIN